MARIPTSTYVEEPAADARLVDGVQDGLAKISASAPRVLDPIPVTVNAQEIARSLNTSRQLLAESNVRPEEFHPTVLQTFGAYFREGNTVGSAVSSKSLAEGLFPTPNSPQMSTDDVLQSVEQAGLGAYRSAFEGVRTVADYLAVRDDLLRQQEDARIQQASTGFTAAAAMLAAGIIDLPTLLPGSIGWKAGTAGLSLAKGAAGVAGGALLGSTVSEAALQATQVNRSWETSAASIGGSIILGGMLGAGLQAVARRSLGNSVIDTVTTRLENTVADLGQGAPAMKSAGAAAVSAYEKSRLDGVSSFKPVSSFGSNEALTGLGRIPGFLGRNLRIPMLDLNASQSTSALAARQQLTFMPQITAGNVAGDAVQGPTVAGIVRDFREQLVEVVDVEQKQFAANKSAFKDYAEFDALVARSLVNPTADAHPAVIETAKHHREVYTKVLDALVEAKVLPEEVRKVRGETYFPMIFDGDVIRARDHEFKSVIADGFKRVFREDAEAALKTKEARELANADAKARVIGVEGKVGKVDDTGQPVINPKTGKQRQEKTTLTEGEQLQRDRITREQHDLEVSWQREHQKLALDTHDAETSAILSRVNGIYDETLTNLRKEATELLDRAARATDMTPAQRAARAREINAEQSRQVTSTEAERRASAKEVGDLRRARRDQITNQYKDAIAEAKAIRDANLGLSKEQGKEALAAALVDVREGLDALRYTRGGKVADDLINAAAASLGEHWYSRTTGWGRKTLDHEIPGFTDFLKKRRTPVDHETLMNLGFVKSNASSVLEDYARMAGADAALATVFKKSTKARDPVTGKLIKDADLIQVGDMRLSGVEADIRADYDSLRASIFDSPEFKAKELALEKKYEKLAAKAPDDAAKADLAKKFQGELDDARGKVERDLADRRDLDIENLQSMVDAIRGTPRGRASASWRAGADALSHVNYMRLMGGTVISSFTDPTKIAIAVGCGNMVQGGMLAYQQLMAKAWSRANAAEKGLSRAGAAAMELTMLDRLASMTDVVNPHRTVSPMMNMLRKASSTFSKVSGIAYWNAFAKQTSENATTMYLGQLAHRGWDGIKASEQAWLASLGINKDGLKLIQDAHLGQKGDKFYDDWAMLNHEAWTDKEASRLVRHALTEELNNHVVTPQTIDRMSFTTTPTGRVVFQFRQHMISNQMRFAGRQAQMAGIDAADGDFGRVGAASVGFVGLVMTGALVDFLKQVTRQTTVGSTVDRSKSPFDRQLDEWTKTPGMALYNALDRSDTLGIFTEASNILDKTIGSPLKYGMTRFDDHGSLKAASRFQNRSVLDVLAGPSGGLLNDGITAANTIKRVVKGERITRGDFRGTERLIPGQNAPVIQQLLNTFERSVGDVYSWPDPK